MRTLLGTNRLLSSKAYFKKVLPVRHVGLSSLLTTITSATVSVIGLFAMTSYLQRKYIDLIRLASSKFVNWDLAADIKIGAYGQVDKETGAFHVEGNIYDPEFQIELQKHKVKLKLADFPPEEGPVEEDLIVSSRGAKRKDFPADKESEVPGIADAPVKGQWVFDRRERREAILILHKPRQLTFTPDVVLEALYEVDKLIDKCLVTSVTLCSAYLMYLPETSVDSTGNQISLALVPKAPATGTSKVADASGGLAWWTDTPTGILRSGCDEAGKYVFTPLHDVKRPIKRVRRFFRDKIRPEPEGDDLWCVECPPWDPLDEDGEEDLLDPDFRSIDPFAALEAAAREKAAAKEKAAAFVASQA